MEKAQYTPHHIDTSDVILPDEFLSLGEQIARHVHEVWAEGRLSQGWTYGKERSDSQKTHPCLIPYDDLSETEKDYDRRTSMETLKLITKLGFKISR